MMGDSAGYECPTPEAQEVPVENMDTALNPLDGKIQTYVIVCIELFHHLWLRCCWRY